MIAAQRSLISKPRMSGILLQHRLIPSVSVVLGPTARCTKRRPERRGRDTIGRLFRGPSNEQGIIAPPVGRYPFRWSLVGFWVVERSLLVPGSLSCSFGCEPPG
jgi:hypothetical protein